MFKFTHERDKIGDFDRRVKLHIPVGLLMGIPFIGLPFMMLFRDYQKNEDRHTKDEAWKDIYGALIGVAVSSVIILAIVIYLLWRLL